MPADLPRWLSDSDPALRWQVERDLARAPRATWEATRARIATDGFGGRLLSLHAPTGEPSKWLSLYATRVLDWWDSAAMTA